MDFSEIFRIVNLVVAGLMVAGGIAQYFPFATKNLLLGVFMIIFGLATALLEFQIPPQVARYASFMFSFIGRGIFYVFVGAITIGGGSTWVYIVGGAQIIVGIGYVVLEFVPSIEPPANMRDAEASGWGQEQI